MSKPLVSYAVGGFSVALWENEVDLPDGSKRLMKSVSLRHAYFNKKEKGLAEQKITINPPEIGCLIGLLSKIEQDVIDRRTNGKVAEAEPGPMEGGDVPF